MWTINLIVNKVTNLRSDLTPAKKIIKTAQSNISVKPPSAPHCSGPSTSDGCLSSCVTALTHPAVMSLYRLQLSVYLPLCHHGCNCSVINKLFVYPTLVVTTQDNQVVMYLAFLNFISRLYTCVYAGGLWITHFITSLFYACMSVSYIFMANRSQVIFSNWFLFRRYCPLRQSLTTRPGEQFPTVPP